MAVPLLHNLDRDHLIQMIEELQEEKRMREAFSHISETGSNDAALMSTATREKWLYSYLEAERWGTRQTLYLSKSSCRGIEINSE